MFFGEEHKSQITPFQTSVSPDCDTEPCMYGSLRGRSWEMPGAEADGLEAACRFSILLVVLQLLVLYVCNSIAH